MDYKKVIQQIIDNPANTLSTTSKDLLETMAISIELDLEQVKNCSIPVVKGSYREQAIKWWENLTDEETIEVYKRTGNFRLGGWGHDMGPTEEDVIDMYKMEFNYHK